MTQVQVIEKDGRPAFYVVPAAIWSRVRGVIEEAEDVAAFSEAVANDDGVRYPHEVAVALLDGTRPLRAWREHRKMTQDQLAGKAHVSKPFISQIEGGKRTGSAGTLRKLARVLSVPVGALLPLEE